MRVSHVAATFFLVGLPFSLYRALNSVSSAGISYGRLHDQHAIIQEVLPSQGEAAAPPPAAKPAATLTADSELPRWLHPDASALMYNQAARMELAPITPRGTTLHFTFGSSVMMDFVKNWLHFVKLAKLHPILVGAADHSLVSFCDAESVPSAAIIPELDVWTYTRRPKPKGAVYEMRSEWKYFRHHNSDFLEMGLVKTPSLLYAIRTEAALSMWRRSLSLHALTCGHEVSFCGGALLCPMCKTPNKGLFMVHVNEADARRCIDPGRLAILERRGCFFCGRKVLRQGAFCMGYARDAVEVAGSTPLWAAGRSRVVYLAGRKESVRQAAELVQGCRGTEADSGYFGCMRYAGTWLGKMVASWDCWEGWWSRKARKSAYRGVEKRLSCCVAEYSRACLAVSR
eukprot:4163633-Pleurochrysis_carterae.AAC.3